MNIAMARALSGRHDIARLASNENPDGCSPAVMAALASSSFEPWRYADPACTALRAALGEKLAVDAWDREQKNKLATGFLISTDNQIDTATGTVKLKAEFSNDNLALFPNQFVNVRMLVQTQADATLVASAAIQRGAPGTFVYVVKDDRTVTVTPVKLGPVQGEVTAIASGLSAGDMVVIDGADKLREGARVELITREAQAVPAAGAKGRPPRGERPPGSAPRPEGQRRSKDGG